MSTRVSIFCEEDVHIYEEASEPVLSWGERIGDYVYFTSDLGSEATVKSLTWEGEYLYLYLRNNSELAKHIGQSVLRIHGYGSAFVQVESDGIIIKLHPYSELVRAFRGNDFKSVAVKLVDINQLPSLGGVKK